MCPPSKSSKRISASTGLDHFWESRFHAMSFSRKFQAGQKFKGNLRKCWCYQKLLATTKILGLFFFFKEITQGGYHPKFNIYNIFLTGVRYWREVTREGVCFSVPLPTQWHIQGLVWVHRFVQSKSAKAAEGVGSGVWGLNPFAFRKSLKHAGLFFELTTSSLKMFTKHQRQ